MKLYRQLLPWTGALMLAVGAGVANAEEDPPAGRKPTTEKSTTTGKKTGTGHEGHDTHQSGTDMKTTGKTGTDMRGEKTATLDTPMTDAELLSKLHHKNTMEIEAGRTAEQKGSTAAVKKFGTMLVKDHTKADQDVMDLAKKKSITLSALPPMDPERSAEKQAEMDAKKKELETLTGAAFDRAFLTQMFEGHDKMATKLRFEQSRKNDHDKEVISLINKLLPKIEHHRDEAKKLLDKMPAQPPA